FSRGAVRNQMDRYEEAIEDFNEALRLDSRLIPARVSRGLAWTRLKKYDRALTDFNESLRIDPSSAPAYYSRGSLHQDRGRWRAARSDYERAVALRPDDASFRNQLAWLLATCPQDDIRDGARAVEHANETCTLTKGQDGNQLDTLAAALAECG